VPNIALRRGEQIHERHRSSPWQCGHDHVDAYARLVARIVAPKHLSSRSKRIYKAVIDDYDLLNEPHALEVLRLALEALDRADEARAMVAQEGIVFRNRFGELRPHPAVAIERDARLAAWRGFRELSLDAGDYDEARVPRVGGSRS
jgi:phage terminase small subunit